MQENEKIILVRKEGAQPIQTRKIWQYDAGHVLQFEGFELPETFQVHFARSEDGEATTQIGQNDSCRLPEEYTQSSGTVYAWVYVVDTETGLTQCQIEIPVDVKGEATDQEPTPVEQSAIDQAIAALNSGVARAETARQEAAEAKEAAAESESNAEGWAVGTRGGVAVPDTDPTWHNNAKYYAEQAGESERKAKESEDNAAGSASDAESWATGTRDGEDVPDTDPAYDNNAKYYAGQAAQMKEQTAVEARRAEEAVGAAEGHERAAEQAKEDAEAAAQEAVETVVAAQGPGICYVDSEGIPYVLE